MQPTPRAVVTVSTAPYFYLSLQWVCSPVRRRSLRFRTVHGNQREALSAQLEPLYLVEYSMENDIASLVFRPIPSGYEALPAARICVGVMWG